MGKPQTINYTSGRRVEYTYDAAGTKLTVRTYQAATLLTTTNYSGGFVYEGASPALSFFSSPEGRVVRNGANFEYQYAIADHQGNTRLIFSSVTPAAMNITATFEGNSGDQSAQFTNVNPGRVYQHNSANNTAGGSHVIGLNGSYKVGPGKSIKVYPGETVSASVFAYYEATSGYGSNQGTVNQWIAAVAGAFGGVSGGGGESGSIFNGVNNAIGAYGMGGSQQTNQPAAYLNYIIFDQQYKLINMGWQRVSGTPSIKHQLALAPGQIKEPGYAYFYLSYENEGSNFVYFDDFQVTHTKNNIIQYNEYYAFQHTTANSWTRENVTGNNFLGNGGTEVNTTTQLYDLDFRNYDPLLGRMTQVDPMATKYASLTPYNYSFNDPVTFTDVNGADPNNGCTNCEPIFQPYTGFQYNNSYDGFVQDDVIYYRQSGWTGPVYRYAGSALYMDQNVAPGGSGSWSMQLMTSFAEDARRSGNINWFAGMFGMRFGGGIRGFAEGLASLGLSLVPNKPPEPPIRPAIDPKELVASSKTGSIYDVQNPNEDCPDCGMYSDGRYGPAPVVKNISYLRTVPKNWFQFKEGFKFYYDKSYKTLLLTPISQRTLDLFRAAKMTSADRVAGFKSGYNRGYLEPFGSKLQHLGFTLLIPISGIDADKADDSLLGWSEGWAAGYYDRMNDYSHFFKPSLIKPEIK